MSDYIWIEGDQAHTSGANGTVTRVVMHGTVSGCHRGGAREVARYFQSAQATGLAHFIVDPGETVQCCKENIACWHAPPNKGSLGVELCDPQTGAVERWYDQDHRDMLARAAVLVADLCQRHNLPVEYVNSAGLLAGKHGITMHSDVSAAFHQSTHTDPGTGFPMAHFLDLVRAVHPVKAQATANPTPLSVEDDMQIIHSPKHSYLRIPGAVVIPPDLLTFYKDKWKVPVTEVTDAVFMEFVNAEKGTK